MTIIIDLDPTTDTSDIVALCTEATHVDIHPGNDKLEHPRFSTLSGLVFSGKRYDDKTAACACAKMKVYKYSDYGYTRCDRHGFMAIGALRREIKK